MLKRRECDPDYVKQDFDWHLKILNQYPKTPTESYRIDIMYLGGNSLDAERLDGFDSSKIIK